MAVIEKLNQDVLRSLCNVFGDTSAGLTGSEIARTLSESGIQDVEPMITKRDRLFQALHARQNQDRCANGVLGYVEKLMSPVRHLQNREAYESRQQEVNEVLAFAGLTLGDDGKLKRVNTANTISEAHERASKLRKTLIQRSVHADVLMFCREELMQDNYFHAVFEATKSVADKIRAKTGLGADGGVLVDQALGLGEQNRPKLAINSLQTETDLSEHKGFANLLRGFFGMFRNTTGHAPKIKWEIREGDALDILTLASFLHRRLDDSQPTGY